MILLEFIKAILLPCNHEYKTVGFFRDNKEGEFQVQCMHCRDSYWTNTLPPNDDGLMKGIADFKFEQAAGEVIEKHHELFKKLAKDD
jgi:hypothetical protein